MRRGFRFLAIGMLAAAVTLAAALRSGMAQPRPHVYLFRGLADVFSTGMDTLADELNKRGVYATSHNHADWQEIADRTAADYKAKKEGPIILIGHSLGADAAMEMADYLGDKGVPVALVIRLTVRSRSRRQGTSLASSILPSEITPTCGRVLASAVRSAMSI